MYSFSLNNFEFYSSTPPVVEFNIKSSIYCPFLFVFCKIFPPCILQDLPIDEVRTSRHFDTCRQSLFGLSVGVCLTQLGDTFISLFCDVMDSVFDVMWSGAHVSESFGDHELFHLGLMLPVCYMLLPFEDLM